MRAFLRNYRQSPRKVRLVADLIRDKQADAARVILDMAPKRAALPLKKLLESAVANAKHNDKADEARLFVRDVRVDEGPTLKRTMPRARGSAYLIRKRTSHVSLVLGERATAQKSKRRTKDGKNKAEKERTG